MVLAGRFGQVAVLYSSNCNWELFWTDLRLMSSGLIEVFIKAGLTVYVKYATIFYDQFEKRFC